MTGSPGKSDLNAGSYQHLRIVTDRTWLPCFSLLLQRGFRMKARVGCGVAEFLREQIGLSPETIEKIQSIFLDGRPVDDLDATIIRDGSTLALSAAMPGLVGATLRRGGAYSSFRSTITHREAGGACISSDGFVQVKLFNLLMAELGPDFLRKGVVVPASDVQDFLSGQSGDFFKGCRQILLNGRPLDTGELENSAWLSRYDRIYLSVAIQK